MSCNDDLMDHVAISDRLSAKVRALKAELAAGRDRVSKREAFLQSQVREARRIAEAHRDRRREAEECCQGNGELYLLPWEPIPMEGTP